MLNQQHPLLSTIDSYIEPLLKRVLQTKRLGICHLIKLDSVSSSCDRSKNDCFKLSIPYAGEHLAWNILFDSQFPEMGPDFIFNDQNFLMDPDIDILSTRVPSLVKWNPNDTDALLNVLHELLLYYKEHQVELLGKQGDRLQFEYSTLVGETEICKDDIEVMMLPLGSKPMEAKFLIRICVDCSRLPPRINKSQNEEAMLLVTFYGPDWNRISSQLYLTKTLEDAFGGSETLHIPPLPPNKYLMDYVPEVIKFIEEKINMVVQCFENRKQFITVLIVLQRGSVLEYDAIEFNWITILLEYRDFHFIVQFHLPSIFPKEKPQITLQSVYHMTSQGTLYKEVLDETPYSPRWPMKVMINKLLTYIIETAVHKFQANSIKNNRF
ncbi:BRISC and BRCA1-A complex member 2 [Solenopsis invicta]|uniref:BRISC and BRCA1-A complex member 2 n=1 Tax=Solenopsis invicta TaxID=13686 RepID=UPI00193D2D0E|nr:BRISC and BRCA1-A complex member 2 [Solenopsis invicta]